MHEEVISDTTPLQYLHQAGCLDLLPALYGSITVPEGVAAELAVGHAQGVSLPDLDRLDWVRVRSAPHLEILPLATDLGQGEREVLSLAAGRTGVLVLLDDGLARHFAKYLEISFTGTLGVLLKAKTAGHLDAVRPILDQLQMLGFWLDSATRSAVLRIANES
jgi:predicted nucleic acid-binding protein